MALLANVSLTNTFDTWRTRTNQLVTRINQFAINESSLYANTLTSNTAFTAKGTATVTGLFTASGRATVGTNLTVSGNTTLGAASKTITTTGAWSHTGWGTITTNLNVSGNTTFGGVNKTSNTTGWFGVNGRATVSTNLFVGGNTSILGKVGILTSSPYGSLTISQGGQPTGSSPSSVPNIEIWQGSPTINDAGGIDLRGSSAGPGYGFRLSAIDSTGVHFVIGNRNGATTYTEQFRIASSGAVTVAKSATISNNLTVSGNTTITGLTTMSGRATVGTNLTVSGNTTLGGASKTITMGGAASTLTIGGAGHTTNTTGWFGVAGRATVSTNLFVGANTIVLGNMGVGTTSPVNNAGYGGITIRGSSGAITSFVTGSTENFRIQGETGATTLVNISAIPLVFKTSNIEQVRIAESGLVTAAKSVAVTNNLTVSGNTTLNGTTVDKSNTLSQTLADGATINWDVALGRVATVTLGAAGRTMAAPTNLKVGTYILRVYQDGTGSRTITTWNSVFKWTAAVAPVLSTGAGKLDIITFFSDGTNLYGSYLPDMR